MSSKIDRNKDRLKQIYDKYRNLHMSRDYYACRLALYQRYNLIYEIALAVGTSGAVGGWYIWQTSAGKITWAVAGGGIALLAVIKPIVQLPKQIESYSKLHVAYSDLYYVYKTLIENVEVAGGLTAAMEETVKSARSRYNDLALKDDPTFSTKLLQRCQGEVNRKVDKFAIWYPAHIGEKKIINWKETDPSIEARDRPKEPMKPVDRKSDDDAPQDGVPKLEAPDTSE
jgi:hypothetical protein